MNDNKNKKDVPGKKVTHNRNYSHNKKRPQIRVLHKSNTPAVKPKTQGTRPNKEQKNKGTYQYGSMKGGGRKPVKRPSIPSSAHQTKKLNSKNPIIQKPEEGVIRIIPLGGVEEIGKNMTAIEIGDDIIVIDAGMQFKTDDTPGIDYMIPNTTYLEERKDKIRAMIVTHGHLDHIGGIPIVMDRIGNPPLYSRNLSILLIQKRQSEFPHLAPLDVHVVEKDSIIMAGNIKVRFFGVTHTVPDSMGIIVETPYGVIVTPGDYKLDQIDGIVTDEEEKEYAIFDKENVLLLMTDSTNIENEGYALPEIKVHEGLERMIRGVRGRLIIAAFASHITRLIKIVEIAEALGKKIVFEGRSIKTNMEVAALAGILASRKDTIIPIEEIDSYAPDKVIVLMTGAQGEEFAALNRAANKTHKKFALRKGDTIILSASIVPGNEVAVARMKDGLARQGVRIISYRTGEEYIHATGHGNQEDIKWLHKKTHPKFFIPIHGSHYMLKRHAELAYSIGMDEDRVIVPDNGSIIEIIDGGKKMILRKEKAPSAPMIVDGFSVGDEQDVVIRDRQMLAQDGMFVLIATIDSMSGKLRKSPDIISRGFIYLKENQELLHQTRLIIKKTIEDGARGNGMVNLDAIKIALGDNISKFLYQKTAKRPLVIPVLLNI